MSQSDFTQFPGNLATAIVDRGVTNGHSKPNGGGSWTYGWHSLQSDVGASGMYYVTGTDFDPMAKGGSIRCALRRYSGNNCTPFMYLALQGADLSFSGYLMGLAHDESPARLVMVKGTPAAGLQLTSAIMQSTAAYEVDDWQHFRMDVIRQPSDDVLIQVFENDLTAHTVAAPTWVAVPGMESFIDDNLGINSGSQPYLGGYCGIGYYTKAVGCYAFADYLEIFRQL